MTDIVERLRMDASITSEFVMAQDDYIEAADTIVALRQQLAECQAELKQVNESMKDAFMSGLNEGEKLGKRRGVLEVSIWFENETVKEYNSREIASTLRRMVGEAE
jgi:hypothetical protein